MNRKSHRVEESSTTKQDSTQAGTHPSGQAEYAGSWVSTNYWLKIGLSKSQLALITKLGKQYRIKDKPAAQCARILIMLALANLEATEHTWRVIGAYAEAEGLTLEKALFARAQEALAIALPIKKTH